MKKEMISIEYLAELGHRLKSLRLHLKLTQGELAEKLNVSRPLISTIENNFKKTTKEEQKRPAIEMLVSMIDLGVNTIWFLKGTGPMMSQPSPLTQNLPILENTEIIKLLNGLKDPLMRAFLITHFIEISHIHRSTLDKWAISENTAETILNKFPDIPKERAVLNLLNHLHIPMVQHLMSAYYYFIIDTHAETFQIMENDNELSRKF